MQSLQGATISGHTTSPDACSAALLEGLPPVMWFMRRHLRRHPTSGLTVPQYRFLNVLDGSPAGSLSEVAENLGMELPSASRLATCLVDKGLVERKPCKDDRRQMGLALTLHGRKVLNLNRLETQRRVADELSHLTNAQREVVAQAMTLLKDVFSAPTPAVTRP